MDLTTNYMGLTLSTPIIAGSSGMTGSVKQVKALAEYGAGAVVLKSIFEEEVMHAYADFIQTAKTNDGDPQYFDHDGQRNPIEYYDYVMREYVTLPTQYIAKENTVLFPMADAKLDPRKDTALFKAFE